MKAVIVILFAIVSATLCGQDPETDSLRQCLAVQKDTLRVNSMIRLAQKLRNSIPTEAEALFKEALDKAASLNHWKGEVRAHNSIGILYGMRGDYPLALVHFRQALDINERHQHLHGLADSYSNIGIIYKRISNYPLSLQHYREALNIYNQINYARGIAAVYQNMAVLHDLMGEQEESYDLYRKAYALEDSMKNMQGMAIVIGNMGLYHLNKKDYPQADEHIIRYIELGKQLKNNNFVCDGLMNLGASQLRQGNLAEARNHLTESLVLARELGNRQSMATAHLSLGELAFANKQFMEAQTHGSASLDLAQSLNNFKQIAEAHLLLSKIYEANRQLALALKHQRVFSHYKDSLFNDEKIKQFKAQQVHFAVNEKDAELASQRTRLILLSKEVELNKKWLIVLIAFLASISLALILIVIQFRHRRRSNELLNKKNKLILKQKREIEVLNSDLEKRMLRAQMNPHFIFNALSSIQHFITLNDKASALKYLSRFSQLLRQVLETSMDVNVLLSEEIALIKIYLELESLRFQERFNFELEIDPDLDISRYEVPVLLFQPFIENAILHGLVPKEGERKLWIRFFDDDDRIGCTITDNGIGRDAAAERKVKTHGRASHGISVTAQRLALLEKNRNVKTDIQINDLVDPEGFSAGTQVEIKIPKT